MPLRRPSASAVGHLVSSATSSSTRVHRSNDSYQAFSGQSNQSHSILPSSSSPTPQQKIVQVLVNRLKNKLPCNSGLSLDILESDKATQNAVEALVELAHHDSLDLIAWALSELLERLAKPSEVNGHWTIETLQSQLFILKVLSVAMASRWNQNRRSSSRTSNQVASDLPSQPASTRRNVRSPSEHSSTLIQWTEPPPLDDNCARYILSVMVLFLRQTTPPDCRLMPSNRPAGNSYHGFESLQLPESPSLDLDSDEDPSPTNSQTPPTHTLWNRPSSTSMNSGQLSMQSTIPIPTDNLSYERTPVSLMKVSLSLNTLIAKFSGLIVYHLSASNWTVVFHRLRNKIHYLASTSEENPDVVDLNLMTYSALDRARLIQVLNELSSLLVNMRRETQMAIAVPLRIAIWNWIHLFPSEYADVIRSKGRMEGSPERVFDLLHSMNQTGAERTFWPILTALHCITSERLTSDLQLEHFGYASVAGQKPASRKEYRIVEDVIKHANTTSKLSDVALICTLDICRAAIHVPPEGEVPLRLIGNEIAHEIKSALWTTHNQKPFWDNSEEIDVALYSEALVTIFHLLPSEESFPLFLACLEPERSEVVKICAVKACLTLALEASQFPWRRSLDKLEVAIAPRLRSIFKNAALRRNEQDQYGNVKRAASRPKAKRTASETLSDREALLLGILSLWQSRMSFFLQTLQGGEVEEWTSAAIRLWETTIDISIRIATACSFQLIAEIAFTMRPTDSFYEAIISWMKHSLSATLVSVVTSLIHARTDMEAQRLWMSTALHILEIYTRKVDYEHIKEIQHSSGRLHAFALAEIAFVVSLSSADSGVSQAAAKGLRVLAQTDRPALGTMNSGNDRVEREYRNTIYEQLGDPNVMVVGRVGHQKRIRKLVRSVASPSAAHIAIWEECFWRWRSVSEVLIESLPGFFDESTNRLPIPLSLEDTHFQWRNLTLFLAAYSGACALEDQAIPSLTSIIPIQYLPDEMRALQHPGNLVATFISDLTNLLVSDTVEIRDVARDALGYELHSGLYSRLLKHLDQVIYNITQGAGSELTEAYSQFLDQFVAVLKLLMEKAEAPLDEALSLDISSTLLALASFITRFNDLACYRIKIKFCLLCDSVCEKTKSLTLRKDNGARHDILDILMEWIQDSGHSSEGDSRVQDDLNMSCLRTTVKFLDRLQLRPLDDPNEEDSRHGVSRLFVRYSGILLRCLDALQLDHALSDVVSDTASTQHRMRVAQRDDELRNLVVTGLSNLVSSNPQSGVKRCLPLAYDIDPKKRLIFAQVFARVLGQGTKFHSQNNSVSSARQTRLRELVKAPDMVLPMAICETCPPAEVDIMISVLLNLFDTRVSLMSFLKLMLDREIAHTENEAALFRSNSTCTKFLSAFAKIHGYNYLRSLIIPLIKTMSSMPHGHGYDLDPTKAGDQDVKANQANVELVASSFLEIVSSSVPALPSMFREISAHIAKSVNAVWPDAKFAALGAFIFLRFISPAVVAPEIVDVEVPKDDSLIIRRGLMVVAKIIQNLANNIFFGKEAHMVILNTFLEDNIVNVTRFLSEINKYPAVAPDDDDDEWLGTTSDDTDTIVLHRFFDKHADKIGKELLSYSRPSPDGDESPPISGKNAWDALCSLLVDMGSPLGVPQLSPLNRSEHQGFIELMSRYAHRNTDSVRSLFVATPTAQERTAVFILYMSKIDVEALDIDMLMYYIFKTLSTPPYEDRQYEIILDCTAFASMSEVPVQWLKFCTEMIPSDIRKRLVATHILNANSLAQRYLRRLHNVSAGIPFAGEIKAYSSVTELAEHVSSNAVTTLAYASSLDQELRQAFKDVTMRQDHQMRMPVVLEVGLTHLRITSVKAQPISPTLTCRSTEIISLTDVSDVYNVSTGHDPFEFIIRRSRQGITLYFSSPDREVIIKNIRAASGKMKQNCTSLIERFPRFSNVPATLIHIGMMSIDSSDDELRTAAYDLLRAVCSYLDYDKNPVVTSNAGFIPGDPCAFAVNLSEQLAEFAPELTIDFISEASAGMEAVADKAGDRTFAKASTAQRINCLLYMSPWIKNLAYFTNPTSQYYEHSGARLRDCVRVLSDLTIADAEVFSTIQKYVWAEIGKLDSTVVNIVLDELIRGAIDGGMGSTRCETIARIVSSLSSINVRGKLLSKLRRALGKTSMKPSRTLADNIHWNEIATLVRLTLVAGNPSRQPSHNQFYVPEILHLVTLIAGTGQTLVRKSVYGIIMNLLQSLYAAHADDIAGPELLLLINECTKPDTIRLFGLLRTTATSEYTNVDPANEKLHIDRQECLTRLLVRVMEVTAGSQGLFNVWRARWMSLVTSMAFQLSAAIQPRAFIVIGTLATSDVDDDLLYQMLVAFKTALSQSSETNTTSVVSMLRCICKIVPALVENSRYICQVFWLAVALLQSSHIAFYVEATNLLRVTLEHMENQGIFTGSVHEILLDGRTPLEDIACQLDQLLGLSFDSNFSFSLASIIFKGVRHSGLKDSAEAALRSLLRVTVRSGSKENGVVEGRGVLHPDALGYFLALLPLSTSLAAYHQLLEDCNVNSTGLTEEASSEGDGVPQISLTFIGVNDANTALLLTSFIGAILTTAQGDDAETEILYNLLSDVAVLYPDTVSMAYEGLQDRIKDTFANSSNPSIISSVSNIFRVSLQDPTRQSSLRGSSSTLGITEEGTPHGPGRKHLMALEDLGMQGLASSFQFLPLNRGHATKMINWIPELVVRIIE